MADLQHLAQLRDIHLPTPIGWWPPALGWIGVVVISLFIISLVLTLAYNYRMHSKPKRQACKLLADYEQQYHHTGNASATCAKISELLRRVALAYFPRQDVASLQEDAWINFLNHTSKNINFNAVRHCLLELPYQNQTQNVNLKPLFTRAYAWIKQRGVPCLH